MKFIVNQTHIDDEVRRLRISLTALDPEMPVAVAFVGGSKAHRVPNVLMVNTENVWHWRADGGYTKREAYHALRNLNKGTSLVLDVYDRKAVRLTRIKRAAERDAR